MTLEEANHRTLTAIRAPAFEKLFGDEPIDVFPSHTLKGESDGPYFIDVLVYSIDVEGENGPVVAAVTNGMSDQRMAEGNHPEQPRRRELIQYLRECTLGHAQRLRDMAWLPLFDGFLLDSHHTVAWEWPAVESTPWKNAFFCLPLIRQHREFSVEVEGDSTSFLWHIPISDDERAFKMQYGSDALLDRMDEIRMPWIFDEKDRPPLVP
jgi:hypothetical protein